MNLKILFWFLLTPVLYAIYGYDSRIARLRVFIRNFAVAEFAEIPPFSLRIFAVANQC
jgi:hypothetical protein